MRSRKIWLTGSTSLSAENDARAVVPVGGEPLSQESDILRREVEPRHRVPAIGETDQVRPGPASDVERPADPDPGVPLEAVDEEVDLELAVRVERDLVEPGGGVVAVAALHRRSPHHVSMASRMTQAAAMPVRPVGSHAWATSTRSPPITRHSPSIRTISTSSGTRSPPGSGEPVPGASAGSRTSTSIVT